MSLIRNLRAAAAAWGFPQQTNNDGLQHLRDTNPKLDTLLAEQPGVAKFLEQQLARGTVSSGPAVGEVMTPVTWSGVWTHSEGTESKYHHGMKNEQIKNDIIVVFQDDPSSNLQLGSRRFNAKIVGLFRAKDLGQPFVGSDGGFIFPSMRVVAHGKAGSQADVQWGIMTIDDQGNCGRGGFAGGYPGRRTRVTHGQSQRVPISE